MTGEAHHPLAHLRRFVLLTGWFCFAAAATAGCHRTVPAAKAPTGKAPVGRTAGAAPDDYLSGAVDAAAASGARVFTAELPLPKPAGALPADASCVTSRCHASFATAAHIHGPVAKGACSSCHAADAGGHKYPLLRQRDALCTFCHAIGKNLPHQHKAMEQGCAACHVPHTSPAKFLVKGGAVQVLCVSCHRMPPKRYVHSALARGECTLCHRAHEADNRKLLLGGEGPRHCFLCHEDIRQALAELPRVHKPATQNCTSCHSPHASDFPNQLSAPPAQACFTGCHRDLAARLDHVKVTHAAMQAPRECSSCHDPHAAARRWLLPQRMDAVCLTCHDKPLPRRDGPPVANMKPVLAARHLHGPLRDGRCSECHDAHGAALGSLLRNAFPTTFYTSFDAGKYALCFSCHAEKTFLLPRTDRLTDFRNGGTNLHFVHVNRDLKGRTCKTCHAVHGSDLPKHMAGAVPFEGSRWAMPIEYRKSDTGGSCSPGCHGPAEYDRVRPAAAPAKKPTTRPDLKETP